jgi:hypothetical protein
LRSRQVVVRSRRRAERNATTTTTTTMTSWGALALARRAHGVKKELTRVPKAGEKSWVKSGVASLLLGPLGWLYAGSFREAVPASAAWVAFGALASKVIPMFLLMPVLMVIMPLSAIAGAVYALSTTRRAPGSDCSIAATRTSSCPVVSVGAST